GESHIEHLGSREGIAKAKLEIRNGLKQNGYLIIDGDEPLLKLLHNDKNIITCGFDKINDVRITNVQFHEQSSLFQISNEVYTVPLLGKHHAEMLHLLSLLQSNWAMIVKQFSKDWIR